MSNGQNFLFDDAPAPFLLGKIGSWQKDHTHRKPATIIIMPGAGNMLDKEIARYFDMNTGTITGHTISINSAAMPDGLQRLDRRINHSASGLAIARGNKSHTAGIMFHVRRVHASCLQPGFIGSPAGKIAVCIKTGFI
jgi:hypothetical protein